MSPFKTLAALGAALLLAACAAGQGQSVSSGATAPAATAQPGGGVAASLDINVANTIVRVGDVPNEVLIREDLEEFKSGLYWSRGQRPTDAVITIGGERAVAADEQDVSESGRQQSFGDGFGQSELFGAISLVDAQTGEVVVAPIQISVDVGANRDAFVGITEGSKAAVEVEYLVQKFILAGREALYGKGV